MAEGRIHERERLAARAHDGGRPGGCEDEIVAWIGDVFALPVVGWHSISGGNRYRSWIATLSDPEAGERRVYVRHQPPRAPSAEPYTIEREAMIYQALEATAVPAPRLLAASNHHHAIVTTALDGRADYRRLKDETAKAAIASDFVRALAVLHATPAADLPVAALHPGVTIAQCARDEIAVWRAMYEETNGKDPLIVLALRWLGDNVPSPAEQPVLVHGDAGPGNFLFENDRVTGLVDWELAHPGDPIEDLAWFCMRSVMEPVPDIKANLEEYAALSGRAVDRPRLLYYRVFVSTRVVIIRHRNVTGLPGNSIVSGSLNRRLLVDALLEAEGIAPVELAPDDALNTSRTALYDGIIGDLKQLLEHDSAQLSDFAKNAAKVLKYLREYDRIGEDQRHHAVKLVGQLLGEDVDDLDSGRDQLATALSDGRVDHVQALRILAVLVKQDAALAAPSSGGMAQRDFPVI